MPREISTSENKQVERFISLGCDTLCVNPVDRTTSSGIIDAAAAADIPVVFFNRQPVEEDMDRWDRLYYVGADAKESAVLEAEIVADQYEKDPASLDRNGDGVISYVLLEGESNHQDSLIRTEWSVQTLKDRSVPIEKITGGIANWERSQASALMEQWLELYPDTIELVPQQQRRYGSGAIDALGRAEERKSALWGLTELRRDRMPCRAERCWELCRRIKPATRMLSLRLPLQPEWVNQFRAKLRWTKENITGAGRIMS
ncbi:MAG: substrate-binding domain-containing protein [Clostridium sp.]